MASCVEANSLSSLTALAADPPLSPELLPNRGREPLTLYIAKVPGSRGTFAFSYHICENV